MESINHSSALRFREKSNKWEMHGGVLAGQYSRAGQAENTKGCLVPQMLWLAAGRTIDAPIPQGLGGLGGIDWANW